MACIPAYSLAGTPRPKVPQLFKPSQLRSTKIRAPAFLNLARPTKFRVRACSAESYKLASDVRKRATDAIDSCGKRVTIGDVVSKTGLNLNEAQKALQALAADTNGFLEVSDEGDVVYVFPKDYRLKLAVKSVKPLRIKIEYFLKKGKVAVASLARVTFGMSLVASCVVGMTLAICGPSEKRTRQIKFPLPLNNRQTIRVSINAKNKPLWISETLERLDVALEFVHETFSSLRSGRLIDDVFSVVFGDNDPNQGIEEKRWKMIGQYIALNGGVVTAEELTPYLDMKTSKMMDDDSYMLPVLLRFDGNPQVDEEGNILYHFPSVQCTAAPQRSKGKEYVGRWVDCVIEVEKFLKEKKWKFSKVDTEKIRFVNFLLAYNLSWIPILGAMCAIICRKPINEVLSLANNSSLFIPIVAYLHLMHVIYAVSFFVIELFRWLFIQIRNAEIVKRNEAREQRAKALELPDLSLKHKLLRAKNMARRTSIGKDKIVYSSERDLCDDYQRREWDQIFKEKWDVVL